MMLIPTCSASGSVRRRVRAAGFGRRLWDFADVLKAELEPLECGLVAAVSVVFGG